MEENLTREAIIKALEPLRLRNDRCGLSDHDLHQALQHLRVLMMVRELEPKLRGRSRRFISECIRYLQNGQYREPLKIVPKDHHTEPSTKKTEHSGTWGRKIDKETLYPDF